MQIISILLNAIDRINQRYGALLFYAGISLLILDIHWFGLSNMPSLPKTIARLSLQFAQLLLGIRFLLLAPRYPKYFIGCLLILFVLKISYHRSNVQCLYLTGLSIVASRGSNYSIVLRIYLVAFLSILLALPIFYSLGWTEDIVKHSMGLLGHSWGLYNPNRLGGFLCYLIFLFFLFKGRSSTKYILFFCLIGALIVLYTTMSVTSTVLLILFPLLLELNHRYTINSLWWATFPFLCFALSVGLAFYFGPFDKGSTFVSRFSIPYLFYKQNGVSWLGQVLSNYVNWEQSFANGRTALYINNMYLWIILRHGILAGFICMGFLSLFCYRIGRGASPMLKTITLCTLIFGILQSFPLYIRFDYLLLVFFCIEEKTTNPKQISCY